VIPSKKRPKDLRTETSKIDRTPQRWLTAVRGGPTPTTSHTRRLPTLKATHETLETPTPSDEQLLALHQESKRSGAERASAVEDLLRRHLPRINALVYRMVLDESVADDITQDVFLSALGGLSTFRHKAKFSTWLCRIALNTTYSYLRTEKRSPISYCRELSEDCSREPSPEATVLWAELDGEVRAALSELSPKLRAAIVLTSLDQLDAKEAAQIEGCTIATMYWRIHQARKKLRHRLQNWLSP
jgi:RNA polymerase sigma-70 factor (ECF subfamily)